MGRRAAGFTMVEVLMVMALVAIASAAVVLALRDPAEAALEREAQRLAVLLEAARAEARASGVAARFELGPAGTEAPFRFVGLPDAQQQVPRWLEPEVQAEVIGASALVLGPEPILPPQQVLLRLGLHRRVVATDGLSAFRVVPAAGGGEG